LLLQHAPVLAFRVVDCKFDDVLTWINGLPDHILESLAVPAASTEDEQRELRRLNPPKADAREVRLELTLPGPTPLTLVDADDAFGKRFDDRFAALRRWIDHFDDPSGRVARLNIRYVIVDQTPGYTGIGSLYKYTTVVCVQRIHIDHVDIVGGNSECSKSSYFSQDYDRLR